MLPSGRILSGRLERQMRDMYNQSEQREGGDRADPVDFSTAAEDVVVGIRSDGPCNQDL